MTWEEALRELYSAPLSEFTARRGALAKQLKAAGHAQAAKDLAGQPKPTQAAWALNALVREHPAEVDALIAAGLAVANAQTTGGAVHEALAAHRAAAVATTTALAQTLQSNGLPSALVQELGVVLQAITVDAGLAQSLRQAQLAKVPSAAANVFGAVPVMSRVAAPAPASPSIAADAQRPAEEAAARAKRERAAQIEAADAAVATAQRAQRTAEAEAQERHAHMLEAEDALKAAQRAVTEAEQTLRIAREAALAAGEASREAKHAADRALTARRQLGDVDPVGHTPSA